MFLNSLLLTYIFLIAREREDVRRMFVARGRGRSRSVVDPPRRRFRKSSTRQRPSRRRRERIQMGATGVTGLKSRARFLLYVAHVSRRDPRVSGPDEHFSIKHSRCRRGRIISKTDRLCAWPGSVRTVRSY